jgi:membrane fusion protein, multidrug efflux system
MNATETVIAITYLMVCASAEVGAQVVEVVPVVSRQLERKSHLPGELLPFQQVAIHARVTGQVEAVRVDRGSQVQKGDVLLVLSAPELTAQLAEAQARARAIESQKAEADAKLEAAQSTLSRLGAASATEGAVAGNDLVQAQKAVDAARALQSALAESARAARAAADAVKDLQGYLTITAPFDGTITERNVHPGALVGPTSGPAGGTLLTLEHLARLRLVVAVPEADVAAISMGERVSFTVPAYPGRTFQGDVARLSGAVDTKTRTMAVELDVANSEHVLAAGMYPDVAWVVRRPTPSLLVPPSSIVTTTERSFVVRVRDGRAEWVNVTRGYPAGALVEVFGALKAGDEVVRRGSDEIRENSAVQVSRGGKKED